MISLSLLDCSQTDSTARKTQRIDRLSVPPGIAIQDPSGPPKPGRTGLYYKRCQYLYRPKFICANRACRRMIKSFYDPDRFEFSFDSYGSCEVHPLAKANPKYAAAVRKAKWLRGSTTTPAKEQMRDRQWDLRDAFGRNRDQMSEEETEELFSMEPEAWSNYIVQIGGYCPEQHWKRCPGCGGDVIRVGSNFRIPGKRNDKGWREVKKMIRDGVDMVARFSHCATFEDHKKMEEQLRRDQAKAED